MHADAEPRPPGVDARWSTAAASPWFAVTVGVILLAGAYAALRTGLATTAIGGFAQGDEPRPWPPGLAAVGILLTGAGLARVAQMRRVALAGALAAAVLLVALTTARNVAIMWTAVAVTGVSVGTAAVTLRWHARSAHWRRRRAALVAIVLGVATGLATGSILAVLALAIVLPLGAVSAAGLVPNDAP
jgi:hypothetical protein